MKVGDSVIIRTDHQAPFFKKFNGATGTILEKDLNRVDWPYMVECDYVWKDGHYRSLGIAWWRESELELI